MLHFLGLFIPPFHHLPLSPLRRVRHEAAEALGAIATEECLSPLRHHADDGCLEVAQTCQLALQRIEHLAEAQAAAGEGPYLSVDPTPPAPASTPMQDLRQALLDDRERIFDRYRAMFALRNRGGDEAVDALTASFVSESALLKHEVAYVLGQMQDARAVEKLREVLEDREENPMVRHEAAEALGSIASPDCIELLQQVSRKIQELAAFNIEWLCGHELLLEMTL